MSMVLKKISYSIANSADIPALSTLINSAYRGDKSGLGWTHEADLLEGPRLNSETLAAEVIQPGSVMIMAHVGTHLCGCVLLRRHEDRAYLGLLTVEARSQGEGLGKQIMMEAERWVTQEWGISLIEMTVIKQRDALIAFYRRRGYSPSGETKPFPYDDPGVGKPLLEDLEFVVLQKKLFVAT